MYVIDHENSRMAVARTSSSAVPAAPPMLT